MSVMCWNMEMTRSSSTSCIAILKCWWKAQPHSKKDEVTNTPRSSTVSAISPPPLSEEITVQLVGRAADIADLRADGVEVDDEDPTPENAVA